MKRISFNNIRRFIFKTKHEKLLKEWFKCKGDIRFRLNHNLNKDSIVFDVGSYKGKFTKDIFNKFGCNVYSFEPVKKFIECMDQSVRNNKIKIYNFGLGTETRKEIIYLNGDETSIYGDGDFIEVLFVNIIEFLKENNIRKIDLMELNIEGGEYELLNYLFKNDWIKNIKNIQVQFHKNIKDHKAKRESLRAKLSLTHKLTYDFPFIMENWRII